MSERKVIYLANGLGNCNHWNVLDMLRVAQEELKEGTTTLKNPNKAVLILLDDNDDFFKASSYYAKITASEIITLLTVVRQQMIDQLM